MTILDENIPKSQRELLERWRINIKQVGVNIGRKGLLDEEIIRLLQHRKHPTFVTRDRDFYDRALCHLKYCLLHLAVEKSEAALFLRRVLRHPDFRSQARRMGKVMSVSHSGIRCWQRNKSSEQHIEWN